MFYFLLLISFLGNLNLLPTINVMDYRWENTTITVLFGDNIDTYAEKPKCYVYDNGSLMNIPLSYERGVSGTSLSTVNTYCPGSYKVLYRAYNTEYKIDSYCAIYFNVYDNTPPVFVNIPEIRIPVGDDLPDLTSGLYYQDNFDVLENIKLTCDSRLIDVNSVGNYKVKYTISDTSGNYSSVYADVFVYDDVKPWIFLKKEIHIDIFNYSFDYLSYMDGYDNYDLDITNKIVVKDDCVNYDKIGVYKAYAFLTDSNSNTESLEFLVYVDDYTPPDIILYHPLERYPLGSNIDKSILKNKIKEIKDNYYKNLNIEDCVIDTRNLGNDVGRYQVFYYLMDPSFNLGSCILEIEIYEDTLPVITGRSQSIKLNERFDPLDYVSAYDEIDGDITDKIRVVDNNIIIDKEGIYSVTYSVLDSGGNYAIKRLYFNVSQTIIASQKLSCILVFLDGISSLFVLKKLFGIHL